MSKQHFTVLPFNEDFIPNTPIDPDSWEYEKNLLRHGKHEEAVDGESIDPTEFTIQEKECACVNGKQCIVCVTQQDLIGIPKKFFKEMSRKHGPVVDTIVIRIRHKRAVMFGLLKR